jgi:coenzyme F420 hydrogenase subunit beta
VCPRYEFPLNELEKLLFGRERKPGEGFGIYQQALLAQATDPNTLVACQDGGVVSALLAFALSDGLIEGAAVSGLDVTKPFHPAPRLVETPAEVLECAGTRYTYSPNLLAYGEGIKRKKKALALVGTPCQIQALRRMQAARLMKFVGPLKLAFGLMCTEAFTYEGLMEGKIQRGLGLDLREIKKINIKGKVLVATKSGEVKTIPLPEAKQHARAACSPCWDFSAELADISVGGLGLEAWTFCIIRTEAGRSLFERAIKEGVLRTRPVEEEPRSLDLLVKLSNRKSKKRVLSVRT